MGGIVRAAMIEAGARASHANAYCSGGSLNMDKGALTDDFLVRVVVDRVRRPDCLASGWILDDFPRTQPQAAALAAGNYLLYICHSSYNIALKFYICFSWCHP